MAQITPVTTDFIKSIVTSSASGLAQVFHGTSHEGAISVTTLGPDETMAAANGGEGHFWVTVKDINAAGWAEATMSDKPKIVKIELPFELLEAVLVTAPTVGRVHLVNYTYNLQFLQPSFPKLRKGIVNMTVTDARTLYKKT